jgi:hypothetical protein
MSVKMEFQWSPVVMKWQKEEFDTEEEVSHLIGEITSYQGPVGQTGESRKEKRKSTPKSQKSSVENHVQKHVSHPPRRRHFQDTMLDLVRAINSFRRVNVPVYRALRDLSHEIRNRYQPLFLKLSGSPNGVTQSPCYDSMLAQYEEEIYELYHWIETCETDTLEWELGLTPSQKSTLKNQKKERSLGGKHDGEATRYCSPDCEECLENRRANRGLAPSFVEMKKMKQRA